jgi:hypothetical protein
MHRDVLEILLVLSTLLLYCSTTGLTSEIKTAIEQECGGVAATTTGRVTESSTTTQGSVAAAMATATTASKAGAVGGRVLDGGILAGAFGLLGGVLGVFL